jgi:hypothetical protein
LEDAKKAIVFKIESPIRLRNVLEQISVNYLPLVLYE